MTWFRVDDGFYSHAKVVSIPRAIRAEVIGTWTLCGDWSADHERDGFVPFHMVDELGGTERGADVLVEVGLWRRRRNGFVFVNWKEHQPTRDQLEAKREGNRRRQAAFRARQEHGAVTLDINDPASEMIGVSDETPPDPSNDAGVSRVTDALVTRSRPVPREDEVSQVGRSSSGNKRARSDDRDPVVAAVVDAVAAICRRDIHGLVVWDIVAFLDGRRGPRAKPLQNPARYYARAIEGSPAEVQQYIDQKGLAS